MNLVLPRHGACHGLLVAKLGVEWREHLPARYGLTYQMHLPSLLCAALDRAWLCLLSSAIRLPIGHQRDARR